MGTRFSKWIKLPSKVAQRIYQRGIFDTTKWAWSHLSSRYHEWSLGIKTEDLVEVDELGYGTDYNGYEPINYHSFDVAMHHIDIDPRKSVFLDYGCGKGRAVVLAATHPFRKVIGVEMSAELCAIAENNVQRARKKLKCKDIELVNADATSYELPPEVTVIFLWNSFTGHVLDAVLKQIGQSLVRSYRKLKLIYMLPHAEKEAIADCNWLTGRRELTPSFWTGIRIIVYESKSQTVAAEMAKALSGQ